MTDFQQLNHDQAKALARLVHALRGDWDEPGIMAALGQVRGKASPPDVALAAIRASQRAANRTPAVIGLDGEHWRTPAPAARETYRPARKGEDCEHHPGDYAEHCRGCAADALAGEQPAPRRTDTHDRTDVSRRVDEIRAQLTPKGTAS